YMVIEPKGYRLNIIIPGVPCGIAVAIVAGFFKDHMHAVGHRVHDGNILRRYSRIYILLWPYKLYEHQYDQQPGKYAFDYLAHFVKYLQAKDNGLSPNVFPEGIPARIFLSFLCLVCYTHT